MFSRISDMSRLFCVVFGLAGCLELAVEAEVGYLTVEAQALVGARQEEPARPVVEAGVVVRVCLVALPEELFPLINADVLSERYDHLVIREALLLVNSIRFPGNRFDR